MAGKARAAQVGRADILPCRADERLGEVKARAATAVRMDCMVVNEEGVVFGRLLGKAWERDPNSDVEGAMELSPAALRADMFLTDAVVKLRQRGLDCLPVTTFCESGGGRLVGMLYLEDVEGILQDLNMDRPSSDG